MDLKEEDILRGHIGQHWYYRAKAAATMRLLNTIEFERILDVGAGSGFFSRQLLEKTTATNALCVDPHYSAETEEWVSRKQIRFRREASSVDADLLLMMDVLEHVEDDFELLNCYVRDLPIGAHVLVTVPAFNFLWSPHDVFLQHHRRYTLRQTVDLLERSGLEVVRKCYYFSLIFPLAATSRLVGKLWHRETGVSKSQLKRHAAATNNLLSFICSMELPWFRFNRLAGLSVFCMARKTNR